MDKATLGLRTVIPFLAIVAALPARADPPLYLNAPLEEYPADALAQKLEGNVLVHLHVAPDGSLRCSADAGGRLDALKRPSCLLIARRDIFAPFVDGKGQPVATNIDLLVKWKVAPTNTQYGGAIAISPDHWLTNAEVVSVTHMNGPWGSVKLAFTITPMGTVANCRVVKGLSIEVDDAACPTFTRHAMFLPALGPDGKPVSVEGWSVQDWFSVGARLN